MSLMSDLVELSGHLQQERLFVSKEREQLQKLYENVRQTAEQLLHVTWISLHQKVLMKNRMSHNNDAKEIDVCRHSNELENTNFVDSYKHFSHHDSKYGDLLKYLWENPCVIGHCLYEGEKNSFSGLEGVTISITSSVYGGGIFRDDEIAILQILKLLTELQVVNDNDPRRLLRRGSCAFSLLYKQLCDSLFSARLFLTAALHDPIMRLLMEDEWFYDIDPSKALVRFPPKERQRRFGEPGTEEHIVKQQNYRKFIVDKLVQLSIRFINSIKANLHCFPPALAWLISHVFTSLTNAGRHDTSQVRAACADLVFALFICPAICDPEPYGITSDIPISHIARHNLMQIAQIIQILAISRWDEIDPKVKDLFGRFEKGCMSTVLDTFLEGPWDDSLLTPGPTPANLPMRTAVLMTSAEIKELVTFLRFTSNHLDDKLPSKKQLELLLSAIPSEIPASPGDSTSCHPLTNLDYVPTAVSVVAGVIGPDTPNTQRKLFKGKNAMRKKTPSTHNLLQMGEETNGDYGDKDPSPSTTEDVLVITVVPPVDCPGMIPEKKVLAWEYENRRRKVKYPSTLSDAMAGPGVEIQEKRTRFSLSHDQESIGNTSDCQEAVSEAASSHSVDENELDNFSDMMSANVSGRGSPSISGRDTPLSQAGSIEENRGAAGLPVPVPETVHKQNRVDVTDRFGKFDLERDEIKSTVSDTWSTDVLASDSEPPDQNQLERLEEVAEEMSRPFLLGPSDQEPVSEISETASDAWSTDVLASDTDEKNSELLKELDDQDEVSSIVEDMAPEDMGGADDSSLEALGAVGGAAFNARGDNSMDFGDVFQSATESFRHRGDDSAEPPRKSAISSSSNHPVAQHTFHNSQSLHPPQFHRVSSHGNKHDGRQFLTSEPQHVVRRVWKDKHADGTGASDRHHSQPPPQSEKSPILQQQQHHSMIAGNLRDLPQTTISPSINVWIHNSNQYHNLSTSGSDKAQLSSVPATETVGFIPVHPGTAVSSAPPPIPPRHRALERRHDQRHGKQQETASKDRDSQDSGNPQIEITDDFKSPSPTIESTFPLIDVDQAEPLTLAEQQNTRIDENRLSAALSLFDPFAAEGEGSTPLNENNNNRSVETLKDAFGVVSATGDNLASISSRSVDSAIELLCEDDLAFKDSVLMKTAEEAVGGEKEVTEEEDKGHQQKGVSATTSVAHSVALRSEEKEFQDGEDSDRSSKKSSSGFFRSFREKINKGIKRKTKPEKEYTGDGLDQDSARNSRGSAEGSEGHENVSKVETSDDILAKYRTPKKPASKSAIGPIVLESLEQTRDSGLSQHSEEDKLAPAQVEDNTPFLDASNLEACFAFQDAKRKLRLVLSMCEIQPGFYQVQAHSPRPGSGSPREHDLVYLLKAQLAEATNLQNRELITRLHEVIRCIKLFDSDGCKKLLKSLREEYRNRAAYISYLVRCRQGLLAALSHLQKMLNRARRDKEIISKVLINVCVRMFIESHEKQVIHFISRFQSLATSDEKTDLVEKFLQNIYQEMSQDEVWKAASETQLEDGRQAIERLLMSRIYTHAMFPNGDGDIMRDQLIQQHIKKLSTIISPNHKDLRIPRVYHFECPWPAAQRDIFMINAYKTPKDKLKCVLWCSQTIMHLLSIANEKSVPAADDFMPVLIFVIIKANPPCLLSNIQYVESFYNNRLQGEEQYWWMQFSSAVEFIKTMDYSE